MSEYWLVGAYEGDKVVYYAFSFINGYSTVQPEFMSYYECFTLNGETGDISGEFFDTKEAAEEWIEDHREIITALKLTRPFVCSVTIQLGDKEHV